MARITYISVTKLLDYFDHEITFPETWPYILLYGPNGIGKTRLLELVNAIYARDFDAVYEIPFETAIIKHDDGSLLSVRRESPNNAPEASSVILQLRTENGTYAGRYIATGNEQLRRYLLENTSWRPSTGSVWRDSLDGEVVSYRELGARFGYEISRANPFSNRHDPIEIDPEIVDLLDATSIHFIATQRLLYENLQARPQRHRENIQQPTIEAYAEDIRDQLANALGINSRRTQTLDRTFPRRLLEERPESAAVDANEIRQRYEEQSEKRKRLTEFGLINSEVDLPLPQRMLSDWELRVLETYLDDTDEKLRTFDQVAARLTLFRDILNRRFFNKELRVNIQEGIVITRSDGKPIPPARLSSGEQHELVLMYDLLFNVQPGSLVLIDEPEISLHVAWQKSFMADIHRIAELASLRFVIATHSPQIIGKHWDRTAALGPKMADDEE